MGEQCRRFEQEFSRFQQRKHSVLFNSGASANLALLQALMNMGKICRGDRVGFSAVTWATNVMPIIQMGLFPEPVDCDIRTLNVMGRHLLRLESPIRVLFITNALGFTGDLDIIRKICGMNKILLLEDNCESLGTILPSGLAGNFGLATTFSFYVGHHMSTIEGGMVCTDNDGLDSMLRMVRSNGWDRNLDPDQQRILRNRNRISKFNSKYAFYDLGFNLRPTEITGFLGLNQLKDIEETFEKRERNYLRIHSKILDNHELLPCDSSHIYQMSAFASS